MNNLKHLQSTQHFYISDLYKWYKFKFIWRVFQLIMDVCNFINMNKYIEKWKLINRSLIKTQRVAWTNHRKNNRSENHRGRLKL